MKPALVIGVSVAAVAIGFVGLLIMTWVLVIDVKPKATGKEDPWITQGDMIDFNDHTETWKGKTVTMLLSVEVLPPGVETIKDLKGKEVRLFGYGPNASRVEVVALLPSDIGEIPPAKSLDQMVVTITCKEGKLGTGNVIQDLKRKP